MHPLLGDVGSDVKVFELRVAAVEVDDQRVLLYDALFLLLFSLSRLVAFLYLFDDAESILQVGRGHGRVTWSFQVGCSVRAEEEMDAVIGSGWFLRIVPKYDQDGMFALMLKRSYKHSCNDFMIMSTHLKSHAIQTIQHKKLLTGCFIFSACLPANWQIPFPLASSTIKSNLTNLDLPDCLFTNSSIACH